LGVRLIRVLIVHYIADEATAYASFWAELIAQEFRAAGHDVRELSGSADTQAGLLSSMEQFQPDFVVFAGHGSERIMTGAGIQPILIACNNDQIMAGSSCLFIACLTGIALCPSIVSKGGIAAQGYVKEFMFMTDGLGSPASDQYAYSFTRILVSAARVMAQGGSWRDWYSTFRAVSQEEIAWWNQSEDPLAASVIYCLQSNLGAAVVSGAGTVDTAEGLGGSGLMPLVVIGTVIAFA
jgi:hypothetical protein